MRILAIDPGFASIGYSIVDYDELGFDYVFGGVIETEKDERKKNLLVCDDDFRRTREIARALLSIAQKVEPDLIAAEAQSWPRQASASRKLAFCWGVIALLATIQDEIPVVQITPQAIKKKLTNRKTASKEDVMEAVLQREGFGKLAEQIVRMNKATREHLSDSSAVAVLAVDTEIARATLRATTRVVLRKKAK